MANSVCEVLLTEAPLIAPEESGWSETGAVVDFWGIVRETEEGAKITGIDYEAHRDMAQHQLQLVAQQARAKFKVTEIVIRHRVGVVPVGEASLLVRVGSRHRAECFRASAVIVDELKKRAPIWKHPVFAGGAPAKAAGQQTPEELASVPSSA